MLREPTPAGWGVNTAGSPGRYVPVALDSLIAGATGVAAIVALVTWAAFTSPLMAVGVLLGAGLSATVMWGLVIHTFLAKAWLAHPEPPAGARIPTTSRLLGAYALRLLAFAALVALMAVSWPGWKPGAAPGLGAGIGTLPPFLVVARRVSRWDRQTGKVLVQKRQWTLRDRPVFALVTGPTATPTPTPEYTA